MKLVSFARAQRPFIHWSFSICLDVSRLSLLLRFFVCGPVFPLVPFFSASKLKNWLKKNFSELSCRHAIWCIESLYLSHYFHDFCFAFTRAGIPSNHFDGKSRSKIKIKNNVKQKKQRREKKKLTTHSMSTFFYHSYPIA